MILFFYFEEVLFNLLKINKTSMHFEGKKIRKKTQTFSILAISFIINISNFLFLPF
jgi:hypothetical protein